MAQRVRLSEAYERWFWAIPAPVFTRPFSRLPSRSSPHTPTHFLSHRQAHSGLPSTRLHSEPQWQGGCLHSSQTTQRSLEECQSTPTPARRPADAKRLHCAWNRQGVQQSRPTRTRASPACLRSRPQWKGNCLRAGEATQRLHQKRKSTPTPTRRPADAKRLHCAGERPGLQQSRPTRTRASPTHLYPQRASLCARSQRGARPKPPKTQNLGADATQGHECAGPQARRLQ